MSVTIDLYIIRHGQTEANVNGVNGGPDVPLDQSGITQANKLFESKNLPQEPNLIYASPHARALQTAKLATKSEPVLCPLLQERSFGEWSYGLMWPIIYKRINGTVGFFNADK